MTARAQVSYFQTDGAYYILTITGPVSYTHLTAKSRPFPIRCARRRCSCSRQFPKRTSSRPIPRRRRPVGKNSSIICSAARTDPAPAPPKQQKAVPTGLSLIHICLEHKHTATSDALNRETAIEVIQACMDRYEVHFCGRRPEKEERDTPAMNDAWLKLLLDKL